MKDLVKKFQTYIDVKYTKFKDEKLLRSLLLDVPEDDKHYVKTILESQLNYINGTLDKTKPNEKILLMKVAKVVATRITVLRHIIGMQPMTTPVSLIFTLEYTTSTQTDPLALGGDTLEKVSLEVKSHTTQAGTRKLASSVQLNALQDLKAVHGPEVEDEYIKAFGSEIAEEIVSEVIKDVVKIASKSEPIVPTIDHESSVMNQGTQMFVALNKAANNIARGTRRGCGNFIIVSPLTIARLVGHGLVYVSNQTKQTGIFSLSYVGNLNYKDGGTFCKVLVKTGLGNNDIIMGYKGGTGDVDTGYVYSPYVPVVPMGITVDPFSFEPQLQFATRYGKFTTEKVNDYFTVIKLPEVSLAP